MEYSIQLYHLIICDCKNTNGHLCEVAFVMDKKVAGKYDHKKRYDQCMFSFVLMQTASSFETVSAYKLF